MTYEEKVSYLEKYGDLIDRIAELNERIQKTSEIGTHIAQQYSEGIHNITTKSNVENTAIRDVNDQQQLILLQERAAKTRRAILRNIHTMKNKRHGKLLIKKYIDLKTDFELCSWAGIGLSALDKALKKSIEEFEIIR